MKLRSNRKGFTLIELIIIIIILGILAAVAIPKYLDMRRDAANATAKGILGGLRGANSVLWGNRVINNNTTTYTMGDIVASMDMKGVTYAAIAATSMTVTIGADGYLMTLDNYASPPTTYPSVGGPYLTW